MKDKYENYTPNKKPNNDDNNNVFQKIVKFVFICAVVFMIAVTISTVAFVNGKEPSAADEQIDVTHDEYLYLSEEEQENEVVAYDYKENRFDGNIYNYDDEDQCETVILDLINYNIKVFRDDVKDIKIHSDMLNKLDLSAKNGVLKIKNQDKKNSMFNLGSRGTLEVYIPKDLKLDYKIQSLDGNVYCNDLSGEKLVVEGASGKVNIENCNFNDVMIHNISSLILVDNIKVGYDMNISTISGNISLDSVFVDKELTIDTVSGNIITHNSIVEKISGNTISGSIDLEFLNSDKLDINLTTVSGNVKCDLNDELDIRYKGDVEKRGDFVFNENAKNQFFVSKMSGNATINKR